MAGPWSPEIPVDDALARRLVESQFRELAPVRLEPMAAGWDNTVYLVNGAWVFRFPHRAAAAPLLENELRLLPSIAPRLPLPVPVPVFAGRPDGSYPWVFAGYRRLPGRTAIEAAPDDSLRAEAAEDLGRFFAALHSIPPPPGIVPDTIHRVDYDRRAPQARERLIRCLPDPAPWLEILARRTRPAIGGVLVHGDPHAGQILIDGRRLSGIIDWGDAHVGDPANDLSVAWGFLPASARSRFRAAYGPIDEETWALARFKALHLAAAIAVWGRDVGDARIEREAGTQLRLVLDHSAA